MPLSPQRIHVKPLALPSVACVSEDESNLRVLGGIFSWVSWEGPGTVAGVLVRGERTRHAHAEDRMRMDAEWAQSSHGPRGIRSPQELGEAGRPFPEALCRRARPCDTGTCARGHRDPTREPLRRGSLGFCTLSRLRGTWRDPEAQAGVRRGALLATESQPTATGPPG